MKYCTKICITDLLALSTGTIVDVTELKESLIVKTNSGDISSGTCPSITES